MFDTFLAPMVKPFSVATGGVFTPASVTGLVAWWDFSDKSKLWQNTTGTTAVTADGDPVARVDDKSNNGNYLTQATTSARAIYKTGIQNGLGVARADGVDDYWATPTLSVLQPMYFFCVSKRTDNGGRLFAANIEGLAIQSGGESTGRYRLFAGAILDGSTSSTNYNVLSCKINGASSAIYLNGVLDASGNAGAITLSSAGRVLRGQLGDYFGGDMGEMLLYGGAAMSDGDFAKINTCLNKKWGVY